MPTPIKRRPSSTRKALDMAKEDRRHGTYRFTADWDRSAQRTYEFARDRPDLDPKPRRRR